MKHTTRPLVIANWKMNPLTAPLAKQLAQGTKKVVARLRDVEVVVAPPTLYIPIVYDVLRGSSAFELGAQNTHWESLGAHTGEVSHTMLKNFGVSHVIIGHSERRAARETDDMVREKVWATVKHGMHAVLCVGERTRDQAGEYLNFVECQVRYACKGLQKSKLELLTIAYEPVWAIGTGHTASPGDVYEMKLFIEKTLVELFGRASAAKVRILYGGSVNSKNAALLMAEGQVDGFLVGGASLQAPEFGLVAHAASHKV